MKYGRLITTERDGNGLTTVEERFFDWTSVYKVSRYTESVKVESTKEVLVEVLKLIDRYDAGEILDFGIETIAGPEGKLFRLERTWLVADLRE